MPRKPLLAGDDIGVALEYLEQALYEFRDSIVMDMIREIELALKQGYLVQNEEYVRFLEFAIIANYHHGRREEHYRTELRRFLANEAAISKAEKRIEALIPEYSWAPPLWWDYLEDLWYKFKQRFKRSKADELTPPTS